MTDPDFSPFVGAWQAIVYTMERGTLAVPAARNIEASAATFLNGGGGARDVSSTRSEPGPGQIRLHVDAGGQFTQTVAPDNPLYLVDAEGCEDRRGEALAFGGGLRLSAAGATLVPDPGWSIRLPDTPTSVRHLRHSDGDTAVSDHLRRTGDTLARVIRVMTDGSYTTTITLVYEVDA